MCSESNISCSTNTSQNINRALAPFRKRQEIVDASKQMMLFLNLSTIFKKTHKTIPPWIIHLLNYNDTRYITNYANRRRTVSTRQSLPGVNSAISQKKKTGKWKLHFNNPPRISTINISNRLGDIVRCGCWHILSAKCTTYRMYFTWIIDRASGCSTVMICIIDFQYKRCPFCLCFIIEWVVDYKDERHYVNRIGFEQNDQSIHQ